MDNQRLIELIRNPSSVSPQEIEEISGLVNNYPYSAFLKILNAKIAHVGGLKDENIKITSAAIATVDRNNLKAYISSDTWFSPLSDMISEPDKPVDSEASEEPPVEAEQEVPEPETKKPEETIPRPKEAEKKVQPVSENTNTEKLASDLIRNIEEYKKQRSHFNEVIDKGKKKRKKPSKIKSVKEDTDSETDIQSNTDKQKASGKEEESSHSRKKSKTGKKATKGKKKISSEKGSGNSGKKTEKEDEDEVDQDKGKENPSAKESIQNPPDIYTIRKVTEEKKSEGLPVYEEEDPEVIRNYLEQITDTASSTAHSDKSEKDADENADQAKSPENQRQPDTKQSGKMKKEEQKDIIEKFIKTDPKIKNIKSADTTNEREDLSLKSIRFKDDIISENLAMIMVKQGKLEKAIDIYKKLIWKFPQKKSYFATRIEELKEKLGK